MKGRLIACIVFALAHPAHAEVPGDTNGDGIRSPHEYVSYRLELEGLGSFDVDDEPEGTDESGIAAGSGAPLPSLSVDLLRENGVPKLSEEGNWIWEIKAVPDSYRSSMAVEIGVRVDELTDVTLGDSIFDTPNPGNTIFGWEESSVANGLLTNPATNEVFMAYGSAIFEEDSGPATLLLVETSSATGSLASTSIEILGAYEDNGLDLLPGPPRDGYAVVAQLSTSGIRTQNSLRTNQTFTIPEPATWLLLLAAVSAAVARRRRPIG